MTLTLRSIRLRQGGSHQFDGLIEDIRTPDGQAVRVDREGTVDSGDSQTRKAVERAAVGAALGAIIGAVAGGGRARPSVRRSVRAGARARSSSRDETGSTCSAARSSRSSRASKGVSGRSPTGNADVTRGQRSCVGRRVFTMTQTFPDSSCMLWKQETPTVRGFRVRVATSSPSEARSCRTGPCAIRNIENLEGFGTLVCGMWMSMIWTPRARAGPLGAERMFRRFDASRFDAFMRLLAQPDPLDLPRRAHALRCPGDPDCRATRLPLIFTAWQQRRCLAIDGEDALASAARRGAPVLVGHSATRRPRDAEPGWAPCRTPGPGPDRVDAHHGLLGRSAWAS